MRTGVQVVLVSFGKVDPCYLDCVQKNEEALLILNEQGVLVRALVLCYPQNSLGRCYLRNMIIGPMRLCQKYQIHLVSDEIYALSTWKNTVDDISHEGAGFESVLSIHDKDIVNPSLVHVLWGVSKDFGAYGTRLGVIISQSNPGFLPACLTSSISRTCRKYSFPSSLTENAVMHLLSDTSFVGTYITTNQACLSAAYVQTVRAFRKHSIEHMSGASAAFFPWIKLGRRHLWKRRICSPGVQN